MVIRERPLSCITCPMRRNFTLIFPVTCRFGAGARLALELITDTVCAKSHPGFRGSWHQYFMSFFWE